MKPSTPKLTLRTETLLRLAIGGMFVAVLLTPMSAFAARLELPDSAPALAKGAALVVLWLHIGGGAIGLISGTIAGLARKGRNTHRCAGHMFVVSMAITYLIGALVAPFLDEGQRPNFVAGVLALYLLGSGVSSARRRQFRAGAPERFGAFIATAIAAMGLYFMYLGASSPTGTVDGAPPQAFVLFVAVGFAALAGEINALARGELSPVARTRRHLWRMCLSFFIASGSLFLGQPQVFPQAFRDSLLPTLLAFAPIALMLVVLLKMRVRHQQTHLPDSGG